MRRLPQITRISREVREHSPYHPFSLTDQHWLALLSASPSPPTCCGKRRSPPFPSLKGFLWFILMLPPIGAHVSSQAEPGLCIFCLVQTRNVKEALNQPLGHPQATSLLGAPSHVSCFSHWRRERIQGGGRRQNARPARSRSELVGAGRVLSKGSCSWGEELLGSHEPTFPL